MPAGTRRTLRRRAAGADSGALSAAVRWVRVGTAAGRARAARERRPGRGEGARGRGAWADPAGRGRETDWAGLRAGRGARRSRVRASHRGPSVRPFARTAPLSRPVRPLVAPALALCAAQRSSARMRALGGLVGVRPSGRGDRAGARPGGVSARSASSAISQSGERGLSWGPRREERENLCKERGDGALCSVWGRQMLTMLRPRGGRG